MPGAPTGWVVAGVEVPLGVHSADARPRELEPDTFAGFTWIDPGTDVPGLYPATAALLALRNHR